jgi:hypothetical protein
MFFLGQPWMLLGLTALAIPVIVHLLNRRRFEVIDWGAMRFLQMSKVTRRRLFLEEILLMLLRMGLLLLLVGAFIALSTQSDVLARLEPRPNRDVVLVLDGSVSMNYASEDGKTADQAAREWALAYVRDLKPGDNVAVLQAKQQPLPADARLGSDLAVGAPDAVRGLPRPAGGCDWPAAVSAAAALLAKSERSEKDIILLTDGQRNGWADADTLERWAPVAKKLGGGDGKEGGPRLWAVNVAPAREPDPPNWSLTALRASPPVLPVKCEATFSGDLAVHGPSAYTPPHALRLSVDGQWVRNLEAPGASALKDGRLRLEFTHRFAAVGSHLVTLEVEPEPKGVRVKDRLPDDNVRQFAVEVTPPVPLLIVDGDPDAAPREYSKYPLLGGLTQKDDPTPPVVATAVSYMQFKPELLAGANRPRVLVLADVAQPPPALQSAVEQFLEDGGGVLVAPGGRADAAFYNKELYRDGEGWLPARLDGAEGDEKAADAAARVDTLNLTHPALEWFRTRAQLLVSPRFPRWWKLAPAKREPAGVKAAALRSATAEYPFLVERPYRAGRVIQAAVPLDDSWGAYLAPTPAYVPLLHELVYYLAGARSVEFNLRPGEPLRWRLDSNAAEGFRLHRPTDPEGDDEKNEEKRKEIRKGKPLVTGRPASKGEYVAELKQLPRGALLAYGDTTEPGEYRLTTPDDRTVYYVVQPDDRESDLAACTAEERGRVAEVVPVKYEDDRGVILAARAANDSRQEWWWWVFLLGLLGLLCGEVLMTRKLAKGT